MIGETVGHYRIEAEVGAGGMGVVYRARDTRLERSVALKFVGERRADEAGAHERLLREARAASALNHPHICHIYEVGQADGRTYIAMELVEGRPLGESVPAEGLPVEAVLRYGGQVADALAHAHERGVVHRDLKSANIVITPEGRAKVLDFGLAERVLPEELAEATRSRASLTEEHRLAGTLHSMAPELLRGQPADARSDLWALGVLLYEMAAGKLPFEGQTGFELSSQILHEAPAPLPARVPAGLRAIIQRLLLKEPGQRYQRAGEVRAALEALSTDTAPAVAPSKEGPGWLRGRWLWVASAVFLAFVLTLALGKPLLVSVGVTKLGERAEKPRLSTGGKPSASAEANEYFERSMLFLSSQLDLPRARQMLERSLELDPHFAEARAWYGFTDLLMVDTGRSNDSGWIYKGEEELRRALQDDPDTGRAHSALAAVYLYQGHKELVPGEAAEALQDNPEEFDAKIWLGVYYELNGDYAAAEGVVRQLLERNPLLFPARMNLGDRRRQQGDIAGAIREINKILEQDPQNIYGFVYLSRAYIDAGDLPQARLTLERVSPADRQNYQVRLSWAVLLALENKRAEALREMDGEVQKYAASTPWWTSVVAEFYAALGEKDKALEWLERGVRNGDERLEWFQRDPLLANIREEPRFQQILESIAYRRRQRAPSLPAS